MSTAPSANVRVLELFVELLGARPGRTKAQLRSLPGYRALADDAFETQFQRDKDALREAGVHLRIGRGERYCIDRDSFAPDIEVTSTDRLLLSLAARAWDREDVLADSIDAKAAAASDDDVCAPVIRLGLTGLEAATSLSRAIRERRVVSFEYPGSGGLTLRAVEPWALSVQGRALYLWGWDLDRGAERTFRALGGGVPGGAGGRVGRAFAHASAGFLARGAPGVRSRGKYRPASARGIRGPG